MANTIGIFTPYGAEFPVANFPQLALANRRPALGFDATTSEAAQWTGQCPQGYVGATVMAILNCIMASATTGAVVFSAALEAVTPGDALDLDAGDSFDTASNSASTNVPGTAGYMFSVTITIANKDSLATADYFRLQIARLPADGGDTATGDCQVLSVELRDG